MSDTITPPSSTPTNGSAAVRTVLEAEGLAKRYGAVQALDQVGLSLGSGEIHALVGENGSGKSTLVGIVSGTVVRDTGRVRIDGTDVGRSSPRHAQRLGAVTVFQDGSLIGDLSVAKNLYLGTPVEHRPSYGRSDAWAEELLRRHGFDIDPQMPASQLPPGDRQLIEIVRAVASRPKLLILDEATSALDAAGVDMVLELMREVAGQGTAVLFVTHRLSEVMRVAEHVTVLRDGKYQGTYEVADVTTHRLVELMAGTRVDLEFPDRAQSDSAPAVLRASKLEGLGFGPVDLELRAGEIVGIAGADGNGQVPLLRGLACFGSDVSGTVTLGDRKIKDYRDAISAGVVYLSSDRRQESLFAGLTIGDNMGLGVLPELSDAGVMRTRRERSFIRDAVDRYRVRVGHASQSPAELSGGNQQKVALSRVLAMAPKVVLIDEPTQGVDVRSRMDIYRFLREIADSGSAVVVVSSDASELAGLCDSILVMSRGKVTATMPGNGATEESIVQAFAVEHELAIEPELVAAEPVGPPQQPGESGAEVPQVPKARRLPWWRTKLSADALRLVALVVLMVLLCLYTQSRNETFFTELSLFNVMILALPLVAVAAAQYFVLLVGGIDVSVGATMTLAVVVASFWLTEPGTVNVLLGSILVVGAVGLSVGLVNALLVERIGLSAVIATIATLGMASGVALMLRPTAGGLIAPDLNMLLVQERVGPVPVSLIVLIAILALLDAVLRRTGFGLRVRAVGLNGLYARRLGIPAASVRATCYVVCSLIAALAGVILAAQVGIGDPNAGNSYTLLAIAAPVLGGAALSGGHGSLVGATIGSFILVIAQSLVSVLGLTDGASFIFIGGLTLLALVSSADSLRRLQGLVRARR